MKRWLSGWLLVLVGGVALSFAQAPNAKEKTAAERGQEAVHKPLNGAVFSQKAYDDAWKQWGVKEKPADYTRAFRQRYGLWEAPYANHGLPMGFHEAPGLLRKGLGNDCLLCHAGSVAGQTVIGLGNASLDLETLYEELAAGEGLGSQEMPFTFSHVRGTIEAANLVVYLMQFRDDDLNVRAAVEVKLPQNLCEDIPAWWHLKRKKTLYHNGAVDSRSVRTLMPFLLGPANSGEYIKKQEPVFADMQAYLRTLQPPKYPFAIDDKRAAVGKEIFTKTCVRCHGTYGPDGVYPSKVVELDVVGTDPTLATAFDKGAAAHYARSWFTKEKGPDGNGYFVRVPQGYQAPPLDGVWATAPYFHNGSAPTVYHVLNSEARPKIFTRSYRTGKEDYDAEKLGWKITVLDRPADPKLPAVERRKVYDTTQPGRGNGGHTFGDKLTEEERKAVIEYLKTL
jgi:mono/diheme cytochrome c family protein